MAEKLASQKAIIPAINTASSPAAIHSLGTQNVDPIAVSEHTNPVAFHSKYCTETATVPSPSAV